MFFSKKLWFKSKHGLKGFELAGDWNLWREMAHHGVYYQYESPLGAFRSRSGQLSVERIGESEIERVLPLKERKGRFEELYRQQEWGANLIRFDDGSGKMVLEVESVKEVYEKVRGVEQSNLAPETQADIHIKDQKLLGTEEKVAYYRELAERNPDSTEILLLLGDALEESGFYEQALAAYHQAIKLEPDSIQVQNKFASALSKTDLYFCFCSEHHYILLGQIQHKRGQMAKALAAYRNAIKIKSQFLYVISSSGGCDVYSNRLPRSSR